MSSTTVQVEFPSLDTVIAGVYNITSNLYWHIVLLPQIVRYTIYLFFSAILIIYTRRFYYNFVLRIPRILFKNATKFVKFSKNTIKNQYVRYRYERPVGLSLGSIAVEAQRHMVGLAASSYSLYKHTDYKDTLAEIVKILSMIGIEQNIWSGLGSFMQSQGPKPPVAMILQEDAPFDERLTALKLELEKIKQDSNNPSSAECSTSSSTASSSYESSKQLTGVKEQTDLTKMIGGAAIFATLMDKKINSGTLTDFTKDMNTNVNALKGISQTFLEFAEASGLISDDKGKLLDEAMELLKNSELELLEFEKMMAVEPSKIFEEPTFARFKVLEKQMDQFEEKHKLLSRCKIATPQLLTLFAQINIRFSRARIEITKIRSTNSSRVCPTGVLIYGTTGIGKTALMTTIIERVKSKIANDPYLKSIMGNTNEWTQWWRNNAEKNYDQGYCGQKIMCQDDAFCEQDNTDHARLLPWISTAYAQTTQAHLNEKGLPFQAELVVMSSNGVPTTSVSINNIEALWTRYPITVHATMKMNHLKPSNRPLLTKIEPNFEWLNFAMAPMAEHVQTKKIPVNTTLDGIVVAIVDNMKKQTLLHLSRIQEMRIKHQADDWFTQHYHQYDFSKTEYRRIGQYDFCKKNENICNICHLEQEEIQVHEKQCTATCKNCFYNNQPNLPKLLAVALERPELNWEIMMTPGWLDYQKNLPTGWNKLSLEAMFNKWSVEQREALKELFVVHWYEFETIIYLGSYLKIKIPRSKLLNFIQTCKKDDFPALVRVIMASKPDNYIQKGNNIFDYLFEWLDIVTIPSELSDYEDIPETSQLALHNERLTNDLVQNFKPQPNLIAVATNYYSTLQRTGIVITLRAMQMLGIDTKQYWTDLDLGKVQNEKILTTLGLLGPVLIAGIGFAAYRYLQTRSENKKIKQQGEIIDDLDWGESELPFTPVKANLTIINEWFQVVRRTDLQPWSNFNYNEVHEFFVRDLLFYVSEPLKISKKQMRDFWGYFIGYTGNSKAISHLLEHCEDWLQELYQRKPRMRKFPNLDVLPVQWRNRLFEDVIIERLNEFVMEYFQERLEEQNSVMHLYYSFIMDKQLSEYYNDLLPTPLEEQKGKSGKEGYQKDRKGKKQKQLNMRKVLQQYCNYDARCVPSDLLVHINDEKLDLPYVASRTIPNQERPRVWAINSVKNLQNLEKEIFKNYVFDGKTEDRDLIVDYDQELGNKWKFIYVTKNTYKTEHQLISCLDLLFTTKGTFSEIVENVKQIIQFVKTKIHAGTIEYTLNVHANGLCEHNIQNKPCKKQCNRQLLCGVALYCLNSVTEDSVKNYRKDVDILLIRRVLDNQVNELLRESVTHQNESPLVREQAVISNSALERFDSLNKKHSVRIVGCESRAGSYGLGTGNILLINNHVKDEFVRFWLYEEQFSDYWSDKQPAYLAYKIQSSQLDDIAKYLILTPKEMRLIQNKGALKYEQIVFPDISNLFITSEEMSRLVDVEVVHSLPKSKKTSLGLANYLINRELPMVVEKDGEETTEIKIHNVIRIKAGHIESRQGDCGGIILTASQRATNKIIGIHRGVSQEGYMWASPVTKEFVLQRIQEQVESKDDPWDFMILKGLPIDMPTGPDVSLVGQYYKNNPPTHTNISKLHTPPFTVPNIRQTVFLPVLSPHDSRILVELPKNHLGKKSLILKQNQILSEALPVMSEMQKYIVRLASDDLISHMTAKMKNMRRLEKNMTVEAAIDHALNGHPDNKYLRTMTTNSGIGLPWPTLQNVTRKKDVIIDVGGRKRLKRDTPGTAVYERFNFKLKEMMKGSNVITFYGTKLKDEPMKLSKIQNGATRAFCAPPIETALIDRFLLSNFMEEYFIQGLQLNHTITMNPHSPEIISLYHYMNQHPNCFDADYSNYDKHLSAEIMDEVSRIVISVIENLQGNYYTPALRSLFKEYKETNLVDFSTIYKTKRSNKSGIPSTTLINNLANLLYVRLAFVESTNNISFADFLENVSTVVQGDDLLVTVSDKYKSFNYISFKQSIERLGHKITPGLKDSEGQPFINFSEATFLKRRYIIDDGNIIAPLAQSSILTPFQLTTLEDTDLAGWYELVKHQMFEASLHGKEFFNEFKSIVQSCSHPELALHLQPLLVDSWSTIRQEYTNQYLNNSFRVEIDF